MHRAPPIHDQNAEQIVVPNDGRVERGARRAPRKGGNSRLWKRSCRATTFAQTQAKLIIFCSILFSSVFILFCFVLFCLLFVLFSAAGKKLE